MAKRVSHEHLRRRRKRRSPPGAAPGTIVVDPQALPSKVHLLAYGPDGFVERELHDLNDLRAVLLNWPVCWVNVDGLGDARVLHQLGEIFHLHPLALEDVVNVNQQAKVEQYGDQTFCVTHMAGLREQLEIEQVSLFLGRNFVLTFQERPGWDCLEPVRERIRKSVSRVREAGSGYLAYSLLDAVIDHYFPILEVYGERLETLEDRIILKPSQGTIGQVHSLKRELLYLRRIIWPQREAINTLLREVTPYITEETRLYLRDCHDHTIRIMDLVETYREVCSDLMDLYLSSMSHRMNEIMKVLTIIATVFIPLTFIAGIYGMNFNTEISPWNMPELNWRWGYPACLALMLAITIGQFYFFRRRGWIGPGSHNNGLENVIEPDGKPEP